MQQIIINCYDGSPAAVNSSVGHDNATTVKQQQHYGSKVLPPILRKYENNQNYSSADQEKYLVVCNPVDNSLTPTFSNFTVIRLDLKETPPPWDATVFLHGDKCAKHPYVIEATKRREQSPYIVARDESTASFIHEEPWIHGVHWQDFSSSNDTKKYLRAIHNRPAIIKIIGEVFWRMHYKKESFSDVDFVVYREVETPIQDSLTIHFLQGVTTTTMRGMDGEFGHYNTTRILEKTVMHPNKPSNVGDNYDKFCSFMVRYNSTSPVYMFNNTKYDADAFVRHMFFLQLSEYKPCVRVTDCPGNPYVAFKCMVGYKFHITMDNTMVDGYVSEKLFK